jgi:hypothetical protein
MQSTAKLLKITLEELQLLEQQVGRLDTASLFPVADMLGAVGRSLDPGEVKSQLQVQTPIGRSGHPPSHADLYVMNKRTIRIVDGPS